ncbi:MAG: NAD(P)-dependent oxidoreductase [Actinomycetota bacterium]|nr:MAG: NAD(P)-dependent oxidoreductase [Actinomycetota bacterium]
MKVAVLGMGKMGNALAQRLLQSGNEVSIWNRTKRPFTELTDKGAQILDSPSQAWEQADFVVTFVSDDNALNSVYLGDAGVLAGKSTDGIAIDMSTVSPKASAQIAKQAHEAGIAFLRSPVSGNPQALKAGSLTLLVSGPKNAFNKAEELLNASGSKVLYLGQAEESRIVKLAINSVLAATSEMVAEMIVLCESNGIDRSTILDAMSNSSIGSPFIAAKTPGLVNRDYEATFTSAMLNKDMKLMLELAGSEGLSLPVTTVAADLISQTCDAGFAELDFAALLPRLQIELGKEADVPS